MNFIFIIGKKETRVW